MKNTIVSVPGQLPHAGTTPSLARQTVMLAAICLTAGAVMFPEAALAAAGSGITLKSGQGLGTIANNAKTSLSGVGIIITAVSYVLALIFTVSGLLKLKAHSEHPDRTEMKVPLTLLGVAAGFAAIGEVLGTGIASIWGSNVSLVPTI
jgi:hypothetical protein